MAKSKKQTEPDAPASDKSAAIRAGSIENADYEIVDGQLIITVDLSQRLRRTKDGKGKSMIIGTTNGFHTLKSGEWLSLMVGVKE